MGEFMKHSTKFLKILMSVKADQLIKIITHTKPLLVFWVTPTGEVLDAKDAHFENPPNNDKSVLSDKTHKGHLRGRSALIGNKVYVVIYGIDDYKLSKKQFSLLRRSYSRILDMIKTKNPKLNEDLINDANFITEDGDDILI
jgi:hypothetical protein